MTTRPGTEAPATQGNGTRRHIAVDYLARVEGEGAFHLTTLGDRVSEAKLTIFEPPRLFEGFLRGRDFRETPDVTARICGICPVAYQMSACHALERACGVDVGAAEPALRDLRRLLYCAEWIESHALHVYLLHAPDFLGFESAIHMAAVHPQRVEQGLAMKKLGNELMAVVGGRSVHPVNVRVGGFYRVPERAELDALVPALETVLEQSVDTVRWVAGFPFPDLERRDVELVALRHPQEYPLNEGRLVTSGGLDLAVDDYEAHFREEHVRHSTSLHSRLDGRLYLVGPMARYALNADLLTPLARRAAQDAGLDPGCRNPFRSIVVRAVETVFACEEALRLIAAYEPPPRPAVEVKPRAGEGCAATEAPRGLLYHRYRMGAHGLLEEARIVPPTAQNQPAVEADLVAFAERHLDLPDDELQWRCEQVVRNYDPCISCSTHYLKLDRKRL
jgi:coenzyme F420-reducing hydrogenase alpha subunit